MTKDRILDIGCGTCSIWRELDKLGYTLSGVDVKNLSFYKEYKPKIIYNGKLPFENNSFDVALIYTVLHHATNPEEILLEAKRVASRLIIVEETYSNYFQKYLTFVMDSITNLEFIGHPHNNKTKKEWLEVFNSLGLNLVGTRTKRYWGFFDSTSFYLEKISARVQK